jgi:hypothetical protein
VLPTPAPVPVSSGVMQPNPVTQVTGVMTPPQPVTIAGSTPQQLAASGAPSGMLQQMEQCAPSDRDCILRNMSRSDIALNGGNSSTGFNPYDFLAGKLTPAQIVSIQPITGQGYAIVTPNSVTPLGVN